MISIKDDFDNNNPPLAYHTPPLWNCFDQLNGGYFVDWYNKKRREGVIVGS